MIKNGVVYLLLVVCATLQAQTFTSNFRSKKLTLSKDTIQFDSVSINSQRFIVLNSVSDTIPTLNYKVNFQKATLIIDHKRYPEITVEYFVFPKFLTKVYTPIDKKFIVPNNASRSLLYSKSTNITKTPTKLFDGLETSGFLVRGFTSGNNQGFVTNSSMDLKIEGKLSKDVSIRANIFDTNIPLQENGYSQNITDFDRIYVELFSTDWRVKAGDISLKNNSSHFLNFEKQVSGLEVDANINKKTNAYASGALVKGLFSAYNFIGMEGNQGPYKLFGPNNEPNIVIVGGSEKVFVNGVQVYRGDDKDYTIDYNMGQLQFNTTFPITNDMRIRVEFQYSDRNYNRFISYEKASYKSNNFSFNGYFYDESDAKNSPIQQDLSEEQQQILANAGNDTNLMVASSAYQTEYRENQILYKKKL